MRTIRRAVAAARRHVAGHPLTYAWLALVAYLALAAVAYPGAGQLFFAAIVLAGVLAWAGGSRAEVAILRRRLDRVEVDHGVEREKMSRVRELVHEHYLDAIRDRDLPSPAFDRARVLNERVLEVSFPDWYPRRPEPELQPAAAGAEPVVDPRG